MTGVNANKSAVVLVCEDDFLTRSVMADRLRADGLHVLEEQSAEEAIDHIQRRSDIDLLVTDIRLAGELNGLDLAHWVTEQRPAMRVLAVSGFSQELVGSSRPERYAFLSKPFSAEQFFSQVQTLLTSGSSVRQ